MLIIGEMEYVRTVCTICAIILKTQVISNKKLTKFFNWHLVFLLDLATLTLLLPNNN